MRRHTTRLIGALATVLMTTGLTSAASASAESSMEAPARLHKPARRRRLNKALTEKLSTLNERNMKMDQQLGFEKELKAKARRNLNTLVEIAATLKGFLKNANQHARDCKARGYFASRSQKVHDNFLEILDRLIARFQIRAAHIDIIRFMVGIGLVRLQMIVAGVQWLRTDNRNGS